MLTGKYDSLLVLLFCLIPQVGDEVLLLLSFGLYI